MYDIIGDLHGEADLLLKLLQKSGYRQQEGGWQHPWRKAVFVGDLINKGPQSREVLAIVRTMTERHTALAVPGNHELYLLGYFHQHAGGDFVRPHTESNQEQLSPTLQAFSGDLALLEDYLSWLQTLPLFLEMDGFRVVHAYWHQPSIDFLKSKYAEARLSHEILRAMTPGSATEKAIRELLVGIKLPLPGGEEYFKAKWWNLGKSSQYRDLAIRPEDDFGNPDIFTAEVDIKEYHYPQEAPPLFFGHYNLPGQPFLLANHYTCLDFNQPERALAVAYHWDGESMLDSRKFTFVS
ncbi:MAG: metallophosphoesterase [Cyclobacteriaceae bacterium]